MREPCRALGQASSHSRSATLQGSRTLLLLEILAALLQLLKVSHVYVEVGSMAAKCIEMLGAHQAQLHGSTTYLDCSAGARTAAPY